MIMTFVSTETFARCLEQVIDDLVMQELVSTTVTVVSLPPHIGHHRWLQGRELVRFGKDFAPFWLVVCPDLRCLEPSVTVVLERPAIG